MGLIKHKSFCTANETIKQQQQQQQDNPQNGGNLCKWSNWQGINLQIEKHVMQLYRRKIHNPIKKWAEALHRYFSKEDRQMAKKKHTKRCSASLIIREMQIKTTKGYHLIPVTKVIIRKSANSKCWRGCGEKGALLHHWWKYKLV